MCVSFPMLYKTHTGLANSIGTLKYFQNYAFSNTWWFLGKLYSTLISALLSYFQIMSYMQQFQYTKSIISDLVRSQIEEKLSIHQLPSKDRKDIQVWCEIGKYGNSTDISVENFLSRYLQILHFIIAALAFLETFQRYLTFTKNAIAIAQ